MMRENGIKETRGFSLIELCVVLAATAIMAAVAVPMLTTSMRGMQLLSDARNIASSMTYARMSATTQMNRYRVAFDLGNNVWNLQKLNRGTGEYEPFEADNGLCGGIANSGIAFKTVSATGPSGFPTTSATAVTFNSRGMPNAASAIYLSNEDTHYAVSVSIAGKVQVWRLQNGQWGRV